MLGLKIAPFLCSQTYPNNNKNNHTIWIFKWSFVTIKSIQIFFFHLTQNNNNCSYFHLNFSFRIKFVAFPFSIIRNYVSVIFAHTEIGIGFSNFFYSNDNKSMKNLVIYFLSFLHLNSSSRYMHRCYPTITVQWLQRSCILFFFSFNNNYINWNDENSE